jgi:hypothetical protein
MPFSDRVNERTQRIRSISFTFDKPDKNRAFAAKMLKKEVGKPLEDTPAYRLFLTGDARNGWIVMINKQDLRTDFAMRFRTGSRSWLPAFVSANVEWVDRAKSHTVGLVSRMFFDYLLNEFGTVVGDRKQTPSGEGFWRRQMSDAVTRGYRVGLSNMNTQTIAWFDPTAGESLTDWIDRQDAYGDEHRYQAKRFFIMSPTTPATNQPTGDPDNPPLTEKENEFDAWLAKSVRKQRRLTANVRYQHSSSRPASKEFGNAMDLVQDHEAITRRSASALTNREGEPSFCRSSRKSRSS